jgi:hypothetical protein
VQLGQLVEFNSAASANGSVNHLSSAQQCHFGPAHHARRLKFNQIQRVFSCHSEQPSQVVSKANVDKVEFGRLFPSSE